jgi:WD40 repeat protein
VGVFESSSGKLRYPPPRLRGVQAIDLTQDGRYLATGASDGVVQVFDVSTARRAWMNADFKQPISSITFSNDDRQLAVAGGEPALVVFPAEIGKPAQRVTFQWHDDCQESRQPCKVNGVAFSMDGK